MTVSYASCSRACAHACMCVTNNQKQPMCRNSSSVLLVARRVAQPTVETWTLADARNWIHCERKPWANFDDYCLFGGRRASGGETRTIQQSAKALQGSTKSDNISFSQMRCIRLPYLICIEQKSSVLGSWYIISWFLALGIRVQSTCILSNTCCYLTRSTCDHTKSSNKTRTGDDQCADGSIW